MTTRLALIAAALALVAAPAPAGDDAAFADGLAAYDAGDYTHAFEAWRALAEAGQADAQAALAGLYAQGLGIARDAAKSAGWYRRAAEQGHVTAQINFAEALAAGRGVARDQMRAYAWYWLAAQTGHTWARRQAAELAAALAPAERQSAERTAPALLRR